MNACFESIASESNNWPSSGSPSDPEVAVCDMVSALYHVIVSLGFIVMGFGAYELTPLIPLIVTRIDPCTTLDCDNGDWAFGTALCYVDKILYKSPV